MVGIIPFDNILDIDELGDEFVGAPHIYVPFAGKDGPFKWFDADLSTIESYNARSLRVHDRKENRVVTFPSHLREETDAERGNP